MSALVRYAGKPTRQARPRPPVRVKAQHSILNPILSDVLSHRLECRALEMFRSGLDTVEIAWLLASTPAAAANGLANALERERGA